MELLKLSKFKLQLRALITEARDLRERERSLTDQLQLLLQKQKETEEEYSGKMQELQAELASSNESREKLERKVNYLQNDYVLLENKQNELKGMIQGLLQSRESFLNAYQESTCEMKHSIEDRDRKILILYEKIHSHLSLFDSIEKEAFTIKQIVDNIQNLVSQKEDIVAGLRSKMDHVSAIEKVFIEKISNLENKLKNYDLEFQRKDKTISELEAELEAVKIRNDCKTQVEEKTLSAKDLVIQNLISEKEALHDQVRGLEVILQRIQETVTSMNGENRREFASALISQEEGIMTMTTENNRVDEAAQNMEEEPPSRAPNLCANENRVNVLPSDSPRCWEHNSASNALPNAKQTASPLCQEYNSATDPLQKINQLTLSQCPEYNSASNALPKANSLKSFVPEFSGSSPQQSTSFEPQSAASAQSISINDGKDSCTLLLHEQDSECSTTELETSQCHGAE